MKEMKKAIDILILVPKTGQISDSTRTSNMHYKLFCPLILSVSKPTAYLYCTCLSMDLRYT